MKFSLFRLSIKKIDKILFKNNLSITIMPPKKSNKKVSKKEESEDEYEVEDEIDMDEVEELDEEEFNEDEDSDEERDELLIDPDTDTTGCAIDDAINEDDEYFDNDE